jgi:fructose-1,6-bisphosphatase
MMMHEQSPPEAVNALKQARAISKERRANARANFDFEVQQAIDLMTENISRAALAYGSRCAQIAIEEHKAKARAWAVADGVLSSVQDRVDA